MAKTVSDTLRETLAQVAREALVNIGGEEPQKPKRGSFSAGKGLLAGAGLAAAAPLAKKGVDALRDGSLDERIADLRERVEAAAAGESGDESGRAPQRRAEGGRAEKARGDGSGETDGDEARDDGGSEAGGEDNPEDERQPSGGPQGTGKGRRMPVQQSVDVAVPIETAYNQWTQFEDWPTFMHRVTRVTQEDPCTVSFATKIWGKTKEFTAQIQTQRPEERIKWRVSQGITHTGVVTFHELAPRLTRIELSIDVDPGSLIEKAARGMRHVKRAVRADLHRFKAFIEVQELETGAWRGVIEDGELVEDHDDSYDEERDYSDIEDAVDGQSEDEDEDEDQDGDQGDEQEMERDGSGRFKRQVKPASGSSRRSRSQESGSNGGSRSSSGGSSSSSMRSRASSGSGSRSRSGGNGRSGGSSRSKASSRS